MQLDEEIEMLEDSLNESIRESVASKLNIGRGAAAKRGDTSKRSKRAPHGEEEEDPGLRCVN